MLNSISSLLKTPAWDIALIFTLVAIGFFWGISKGKKKLAFGLLAVYVLLAVFPYIPIDSFTGGRTPNEIFIFRAGAFLALLVLLTLFLLRSFRSYVNMPAGMGVWWEILLISILAAGFLTTIILSLAPAEVIKNNTINLSPAVLEFFASPTYSKWWTLLPIFGALFL